LQLFRLCLLLPMFVAPALAADADNGKRLAEARCVTCHMVAPSPRREVADAPPFDVLARLTMPTTAFPRTTGKRLIRRFSISRRPAV
jgi:mono/diheme cytochrome c family protein